MQHFLTNPAAPTIIAVVALGVLVIALVILLEIPAIRRETRMAAAVANAVPVRGTITRFGTTSADEYSVYYSFTIEGDPVVYHTCSDYLSSESHGALTKPGDVVTFKVIPDVSYVRDFYNPAIAVAEQG